MPAGAKQLDTVAVRLVGRRFVPLWALLRHRGRESGAPYATPLAVIPTETTFVIGLPWGWGTDGVRNVEGAGSCTIRWKSTTSARRRPSSAREVALAAARGLTLRLLKRGSFPNGLIQLDRRPP